MNTKDIEVEVASHEVSLSEADAFLRKCLVSEALDLKRDSEIIRQAQHPTGLDVPVVLFKLAIAKDLEERATEGRFTQKELQDCRHFLENLPQTIA